MRFPLQTRLIQLRIRTTLVLLGFIVMGAPLSFGQQITSITPDIEEGMKPYGSFQGGDIDQVSLSSGKLEVKIPLVSYPQRGGKLKLDFWLHWQNPIPVARAICPGGGSCTYDSFFATNPPAAPGLVFTDTLFWSGGDKGTAPNLAGDYGEVTAPDGSKRQMVWTGTAFETIDGTGMLSTKAPSVLEDQDGVRFFSGLPRNIEDVNGNYITHSSSGTYVDTLGRTIPLPPCGPSGSSNSDCNSVASTTDYSHCSGPVQANAAYTWTVPAPGGGTETFKFCYAPFPTSYVISVDSQNVGGPGMTAMLESIVLPNNTTWTFQYGPTYPTLSQITLPTGGTISYTWNLFIGPCSYTTHTNPRNGDITDTQGWFFALASRSVNSNDGSGSHTWTYSGGPFAGSTTGGTAKITDPLLNDSIHVMTGLGGTAAVYETQTQFFQGSSSSGTLLKTVTTDYNWSPNPFYQPGVKTSCTTVVNVFPIRVTTAWANGQTTKQETDYDTSLKYGAYSGDSPTITGSYGKPIARREYDYASGAAGPLLRQTKTTYMAFSGPNASSYLANHLISLPYTVQTLDGSGTQQAFTQNNYDETGLASSGLTSSNQWDSAPPTGSYRGNNTSTYRWLNSGSLTCQSGSQGGSGSNVISHSTFFDNGNVRTATDPCNNGTTRAYSLTYWAAFPTTITNALNQPTNNAFDVNTGLLTSTTDPNNLTTSLSYDNMWRLAQVNHPDGAIDTITHQETTPPFTATLNKQINPSQTETTTNVFDGLGRLAQHQLNSDPQGVVYTDTTYDALGRVASVSNPHRICGSDITSSCGTTSYGYDALSRKTSETYPDNSVLTTAYCGPSTLVTDPTTRWRRSRVDGLGRLVEVDEPNAVGATVASTGCPGTGEPIWVTTYGYDTLGNLASVLQNGSHSRSFTFDSFSRMLSSTNPEVGTISYAYWPDGPVHTKTDARSIATTYLYDALHRETSRSYSNGDPTVTTAYDQSNCLGLTACQNIGHRTSMTDAAGSDSWAHQVDKVNFPNTPNIHKEQRTTGGITKPSTYYLDFSGNVVQAVYPTGRAVNYSFDKADRPSTAMDGSNGITYATGFQTSPGGSCAPNVTCYTPQGTFYALSIGQTSSFTGLNLTHIYNSRLQPNEFKASSTGGNAIDITYSFADPGNSNKNAGHVFSITNNLDSTRSQNFSYDQLNRITSALTTSTYSTSPAHCWGENYTLDAWGNLNSIAATTNSAYTGCTEESGFSTTAGGNNHLPIFGYDVSGNTTSDGFVTNYQWDAESQLKSAAGVNYLYDGDGRRVSKSGASNKLYWYGSGGDILAETDTSGNTTAEYIFFGGKRIAMIPAGGNPVYYVEDLLGTSRVLTTNTGVVCYDADFYPYGGERTYTNTCPQNYKFEGKERDTETGNDDFGARYYSNRFGRWLSADWSAVPVPVPYANLTNPQTLNLYGMVSDDPESFADLYGHEDNKGESGTCSPGGCSDPDAQANQQKAQASQTNVTYQTYDVHGATASEAIENAENAGIAPPGYSGVTTMSFEFKPEAETVTKQGSDGSFSSTATLTGVTVVVDITVKTPNWVEASKASSSEQEAWSKFSSDLKTHEEGHVAIYKETATEVKKALEGATAKGKGKTAAQAQSNAVKSLKGSLKERSAQARAVIDQRTRDYDSRTDHGRAQ